MIRSESVTKLMPALLKARAECAPILKSSVNPAFRSKYADLAAIYDAVIPALTANGLVLSQPTTFREGVLVVETIIVHAASGEYWGCEYPAIPVKNDPQGLGSATTYAKRYGASAILALAADEDDDGNAASHRGNGHQRPEPPRQEPAKPAYAFDLDKASAWVGCDKWRLMNHLFKEGRDAAHWPAMPDDNGTRMKRLGEFARTENGLTWLRAACQVYRDRLEQEKANKTDAAPSEPDPDMP
jgi:hypothetical protein